MTFPKGHWLDLLELLLVHLGDDALTVVQAPISGFVLGFPPKYLAENGKRRCKVTSAGDCIRLVKNHLF